MIDLAFSNPSTLHISARKFVLIPEDNTFDYSLLVRQRGDRITISIVDDSLSNVKEKFFIDANELNKIFIKYTEDILFEIIEFLYNHNFIKEDIFIEKIILLQQKYSLEFILTALSLMDIQQLEQIFYDDNALKDFEDSIWASYLLLICRKADR